MPISWENLLPENHRSNSKHAETRDCPLGENLLPENQRSDSKQSETCNCLVGENLLPENHRSNSELIETCDCLVGENLLPENHGSCSKLTKICDYLMGDLTTREPRRQFQTNRNLQSVSLENLLPYNYGSNLCLQTRKNVSNFWQRYACPFSRRFMIVFDKTTFF
ncbi:hypothetical protein NPIL_108321 [Nephila pilipes]|uniref:Uncharacterized protein n=1 Tax=Nephila pilipes TaxID=299642 RepID=A0A8X6NGG2_NEPPI|nr:hypothetical protein NPIL_108321 [Nephila pilipes]